MDEEERIHELVVLFGGMEDQRVLQKVKGTTLDFLGSNPVSQHHPTLSDLHFYTITEIVKPLSSSHISLCSTVRTTFSTVVSVELAVGHFSSNPHSYCVNLWASKIPSF